MIERDNELKVIREWVEKTENDYANAANTLKMGENVLRIRFVSMPNSAWRS
jgi:hypothetical protein